MWREQCGASCARSPCGATYAAQSMLGNIRGEVYVARYLAHSIHCNICGAVCALQATWCAERPGPRARVNRAFRALGAMTPATAGGGARWKRGQLLRCQWATARPLRSRDHRGRGSPAQHASQRSRSSSTPRSRARSSARRSAALKRDANYDVGTTRARLSVRRQQRFCFLSG